jgi:hypothetical protein
MERLSGLVADMDKIKVDIFYVADTDLPLLDEDGSQLELRIKQVDMISAEEQMVADVMQTKTMEEFTTMLFTIKYVNNDWVLMAFAIAKDFDSAMELVKQEYSSIDVGTFNELCIDKYGKIDEGDPDSKGRASLLDHIVNKTTFIVNYQAFSINDTKDRFIGFEQIIL